MDKIKIILDTDMGSDCDDAGALAVLHNFINQGKAELLSVVHCGSEITGPIAIKAINKWYGREEIPVGRWEKSVFLENDICRRYTAPLAEQYLKGREMPKFENSVRVMRKTLAENQDVTIVVIGMMNNVAELLRSEGDDISPFGGIELVKKSVKNMYVMAGHFEDLSYSEYNVVCDIDSARFVSENFPCPVVYCGFELGEKVLTGNKLKEAQKDHPVRLAYEIHSGKNGGLRNSWDPITVYCAVMQDNESYSKSEPLKIGFDEKGCAALEKGGKDFYMIANIEPSKAQTLIDGYMV